MNQKKEEKILIHQDALKADFSTYFSIEVSNNKDVILGFGQNIPGEKNTFSINYRTALTTNGAQTLRDLLDKAINENK